jgi:pimeloyl-ACP methyl ester carboxylesterase
MRHLYVLGLFPVCLLLSCTRGTVPTGPFAVDIEEGVRQTTAGDRVGYTLFVPQATDEPRLAPHPAVVLTHAFARNRSYQRNNALYMAQRGIVVLTPDMISLLGGESAQLRNIANTVDHVRWLRQRSADAGDSLYGLIDPNRIGLAGHSAGGAVSFEAAAESQQADESIAALVLLDAVPWPRTIERAGSLQPLPLASLRSEPSACNREGQILEVLRGLRFASEDVRIVGGTHCDPEDPTDIPCMLVCRGSSPQGQGLYQDLMYLFLRDAFGLAPLAGEPAIYASQVDSLAAEGAVAVSAIDPQ